MVKSCCVVGCVAKDVTYFRFPNSRTRCKRWMEAIKLASKPSDKSMVCSAHFHPDDYELVRGKVRLKPKVVPCVFQSEQPKTKQAKFRPSNDIHNSDDPEHRIQCDRLDNDGSNNKDDSMSKKKKKTEEKEINRTGEDVNTCTGRTSKDKAKLFESVTETVKPSLNPDLTITEKDDIEDILTYFHIKQNKQVVERQNAELQRDKNRQESVRAIGEERDDNGVIDLASIETEAKPVFIEIATDQDKPNGRGSGSPRDCLMVLESVQVDLDPSELMLPEKREEIEEDEEEIVICDKQEDTIILLTSSDEDDVIIQEPHIETVEVSDETDEDDVPLVKLIKSKSKKKKKRLNPFSRKNMWGDYLYNCTECQYSSNSKLEYEEHVTKHSTVIHMCHICEYVTASKTLFTIHKKKHKEDKCYECHLCGYKVRHKLSLTYHMKSHNSVSDRVESVSECDLPKSDSESTKRRTERIEAVTETVKPSLNSDVTITEKDDIEDILTYFHIKQNKQVVERQNAELQRDKNRQESVRAIGEERDDNGVIDLASIETEAKPVFIEIATDQDKPNGRGSGSPRDCLMVLESVQVDLDPSELMLPEKREEIEEDEEEIVICDKQEDTIILLTSSDEDDVIIQEPHIETVEVSDETDEDDVPLVKLIKSKSKKKKKRLNPFSRKNMWGDYLYNCTECQYSSNSKLEYEEHVTKHSTVIHMCHICEYVTASKTLFTIHKKKHKEDKCYECHLCGYKVRHKLSLTYHMKSHNSVSDRVESVSECDLPKSDSESTKRRTERIEA